TPNADKPKVVIYEVTEDSTETWSEGAIIYHNPNAKIPLDRNVFEDTVAQCFFQDNKLLNFFPEIYPYNNFTHNLIITE
ncbi:glycosaminoglycan attachment site, partial [Flectobacillus roseus]|nr:glycosaminoglycan attachment site [Flectobacillus roseus]